MSREKKVLTEALFRSRNHILINERKECKMKSEIGVTT